ncbi:hypothetical protein Cgig2_020186 [Carnegiea gigantea]|uniref:Pentatricopeptide repeat-containing protein n=1 Tax=Carnegiea gigantea TaxID=171969 RepID=A0A9Q1KX70_9CARY|nr:hypothetical protein Cgig2_020186 [Carnegiea gigantea]
MWRSIASRCSVTRHLGKKLFSLKRRPPSQVPSKTLASSDCTSHFPRTRKFHHQDYRFFSHSSASEFENETHDHTSSSEELELETGGACDDEIQTHDDSFSETFGLNPDIDGVSENNDAQMGGLSSNDQEMERVSEEPLMGIDVGKLENVLSLLQSTVDESLEFSLDNMGLGLNEEFVVRVLETPLIPGEHLIRFFKWAFSKSEFEVTSSVLGVLARAICNEPKRKDAYALWDFVKEIGEKESGVLSAEILNQLISVFSKLGKGKAAFEVFGKFEEFGCVPNSDTYYLTIEALSRRAFSDWAVSVCQKMLDAGILPESEKIGNIISFLCKGRRDKEAHAVYLAANGKNRYPPQRPVNFLISCLSKGDDTVHLAQQMLYDLSVEIRKHAVSPFSWVVRGLCRKSDTAGAKKLLFEMIERGPPPGNAAFNSVVNALSKAGDLEDAKEMLKLMERRGLKPDVYAYSVIISGYAKGGLMEEACKVLSEAREKHQKLHPVTFHSIIRGYCKLEEFDQALKLLSEMKGYGVEANVDEYNKLIQSLCLKALDWQTAEKLLEEMKDKGLHLPVWGLMGSKIGTEQAHELLEPEKEEGEGQSIMNSVCSSTRMPSLMLFFKVHTLK